MPSPTRRKAAPKKAAPKKAATKKAAPKKAAVKKAKTVVPKPAKRVVKKTTAPEGRPASALIDERTAQLGGWRGEALARLRSIIRAADPAIVEEWKWENPVWSRDGIICTGESYKTAVKMTFPKGASLADPARLFNSSLAGGTRRAIDVREGDAIDGKALTALIRAAVTMNQSTRKR